MHFSVLFLNAKTNANLDSTSVTQHQFQITISIGTTSSGPAIDIENAMPISGFNQPESHTGISGIGLSWIFSTRYLIHPPFSLGLLISNAPIGKTKGYRLDNLDLTIHYSVITVSTIGSVTYKNLICVGVGPAVYIAKSAQSTPGGLIDVNKSTKIGALLDFAISIPLFSDVYADLAFQYRLVGKADIGPFTVRPTIGEPVIMPKLSGNYNHALISIGVGIWL